jgi:hypothetical protein
MKLLTPHSACTAANNRCGSPDSKPHCTTRGREISASFRSKRDVRVQFILQSRTRPASRYAVAPANLTLQTDSVPTKLAPYAIRI